MSYIGNEPVVSATRTITEVVASGGQTVFYPNGGYTVGYLDVAVNGSTLQSSDFTATNGTTVTLNVACVSGDDVKLTAWGTFTTSSSYTQAQIDSKIGASQFGFKNRIINGAMMIDQRNAGAAQTVTTSGAYTVDRFFVQPTGASVTTQQVTGSGQYKNALRITGAASVTQCYIQQKIEANNSYDLAGQTVTVTIRASSSTLTSLTCYVERATAGVDNWSTFATDKTQAITITSTPTDYSFQAVLSGSATNGIRFIFSTGAFTSGTLDITGVQLEKGSTATSFDYRPYGTELALCQRYFQLVQSGCGWITSAGTNFYMAYTLPVTMRAAPSGVPTVSGTIQFNNSVGGNPSVSSVNSFYGSSTPNGGQMLLNTTGSTGQSQGAFMPMLLGSSTSGFQFSAEL